MDAAHTADYNVINHRLEAETSHFTSAFYHAIHALMDANETFRKNLKAHRLAKGLSCAELSRMADLNERAVKDIEEGRSQSPKLSTVIALSKALGQDPGEMQGLGRRVKMNEDLLDFLSQYDEDEQGRLLAALLAIPTPKG